MQKIKSLFRSELFVAILLLVLVSAIAYLPFIGRFGYFYDDWYEMFSAGARGPQVFHALFAIDRPGRAYLMIPLYMLFGQNPLPYNITAYLFRLLSGLSVLWIMRLCWPERKRSALLASLLFLIYPGFLSQPNAIDYQSHIAGLFFATFSIALSLKAVRAEKAVVRAALIVASILFGLAYLSQMEYYAGFEVARLVFLFLLTGQYAIGWPARLRKAVLWYLPFAIVPLTFFTWRLFFFQSLRKATDISLQLGNLFSAPSHTMAVWLAGVIQSMADVILLAWGVPLYSAFSQLPLVAMLAGLAVMAGAVLLVLFFLRGIALDSAPENDRLKESLWSGLIIVTGGMLPIVIADRGVSFPDYSRYTLVSLIGAVLILTTVIDRVRGQSLQHGLVLLLVGIAVLTHFANGLSYAQVADATRSFWWQVSWRIPQMEAGTTLVVDYPSSVISEDYIIWGPANLIYYPQSQNENYVQPALYSAIPNHETVDKILMQVRQEYGNRRSIRTYANYRNILILTQPTPQSCVQVIDGRQPELSSSENEAIMLMAPFSEPQHILTNSGFRTPPQIIFGTEPARGWCYYYEKAAYARQTGNWKTVAAIGDETAGLGLHPSDAIEWMPFLQAYAVLGDDAKLSRLAPSLINDPFVAQQACRILGGMQGVSDSVKSVIETQYCINGK
jgi:hypothetical protein